MAGRTMLIGALLLAAAAGRDYCPYDPISCCNRLESALPSQVAFAGSPAYDQLNTQRWSNTSILSPSCIVQPQSAADVSNAVRILARKGCAFAVKSGGHNPTPGANNIDHGVVLDLGRLNRTTLSPDRSVVHLGAGGTWGAAYDYAEHEGIAFPGGICEDVGIGGPSLGGGQSLFQPRVGWVVDNVRNYEIVLASGDIINANDTHYTDLFRALKGGGTSSNFGVVTQVDVAAFPFGELWGGQIIVPGVPALVERTLLATTNFTAVNSQYQDAGVQVVIAYLHTGLRIIDMGVANMDNTPNPEVLAPFLALMPQILNTVHHRSLASLVHEVSELLPRGYRELTATVTFVNDPETILQVQAVSDKVYQQVKDLPGMDWIFSYIPQPRSMHRFSAADGGNSLGTGNLDYDQMVFWLTPRWTNASYDEVMVAAAKSWVTEVQKVTTQLRTADPFLYVNYAAKFQDPLCAYGEESIQFLRTVARKYDPQEVFQKLVPGGFKISNACGE